jgi:hypothetical protein
LSSWATGGSSSRTQLHGVSYFYFDMYSGIHEFRKLYKPRNNLAKDNNDLVLCAMSIGWKAITVNRLWKPMRRRGSHIFYKIGSQLAVRLLALRAGQSPFTNRKISGTHFC